MKLIETTTSTIQIESDKALFILSDAHFGAGNTLSQSKREFNFKLFIEKVIAENGILVLLGDIFEFWREYKYYIPKNQMFILNCFYQLKNSNIPVYYLAGNHDFELGAFFQAEFNFKCLHNGLILENSFSRVFLIHGDGLAKSDWKYRWAKKLLRARWANWAFDLLHPDWGMGLALWVGKTSRDYSDEDEFHQDEYIAAASEIMTKFNCQFFIHGHTHHPLLQKLRDGQTYINSGDWVRRFTYVVIQKDQAEIKTLLPITSN